MHYNGVELRYKCFGNHQMRRDIRPNKLMQHHDVLQKWQMTHLRGFIFPFLNGLYGVNKYTSNATPTVWRDTGRYPLVIAHAKQVFAYLERLEKLDMENSQTLVRHAFKEQETRH